LKSVSVCVCFHSRPDWKGNIKFHINSVSIQLTWSIFLDFFQNKIIDNKSKDGALWSNLCSILPYMLRINKKKQWKISNCSINFFKINFKFLCRHLFCQLNYCLFLYFRHNLYKRQKFSNSTTCRCKLDFSIYFLSIFNYLNSVNFLFVKFYNSMEHFRLHFFIKKPLYRNHLRDDARS